MAKYSVWLCRNTLAWAGKLWATTFQTRSMKGKTYCEINGSSRLRTLDSTKWSMFSAQTFEGEEEEVRNKMKSQQRGCVSAISLAINWANSGHGQCGTPVDPLPPVHLVHVGRKHNGPRRTWTLSARCWMHWPGKRRNMKQTQAINTITTTLENKILKTQHENAPCRSPHSHFTFPVYHLLAIYSHSLRKSSATFVLEVASCGRNFRHSSKVSKFQFETQLFTQ